MRASYQDSNIFGYKDASNGTVQNTCTNEEINFRMRNNNTFKSNVLNTESYGDTNDTERPQSRGRQEEKWKSTVFDGPIMEKPNRKKLGGESKGTDTLFGKEKIDYENKSNQMVIIATQKKNQPKKWEPVRKTAEQRKNEELYGLSAKKYGVGKKGDGTLMANGTDWKNVN